MKPTPNRVKKLTEEFETVYLNKAMDLLRGKEKLTEGEEKVMLALYEFHKSLRGWYREISTS